MAKQAVEVVGSLGEVADQLGVTTDTLQTFRYAATQVGVSQDELDGSLAKLTKTIGWRPTVGNKAAIDSFDRFGIKVLDAQGKVRLDRRRDPRHGRRHEAAAGPGAACCTGHRADGQGRSEDDARSCRMAPRASTTWSQKAKELGLVFDRETIDAPPTKRPTRWRPWPMC
jgi:hypothetical protein